MKPVRICLLLLFALLLPLRGAVAAAMLCPAGGAGMHGELGTQPPMDHAHHGAGHAHDDSHHPAGTDKCTLCAAFCSLTPLPSAAPALPEPLGRIAVGLTDHAAPPPDFFSDGQERPPRTF
ncbi:DUF2946 family protein [Pelomonas sp. Root1444]|uniref:DUF2946 family protein n=1 Tax=Pelomonas sp. Root1444 TaxID=1736464 RepID=UPI0007025B03|nr:DUF2946 family protein [Pelomonas sp. Root1444]KQY88305.1 hypothetical protein ASD35_11995 [Pelomonas sp. Root1444]